MRSLVSVLFCAGILFSGYGAAATRIAVMNLHTGEGISEMMGGLINELYCAKLPEIGEYEVVDGKYIAGALEKSGDPMLTDCASLDCYYLIGAGLETSELLAGTINLEDGEYRIMLTLLNIADERVVKNIAGTYAGDEFNLVDELDKYLMVVMGVQDAPPGIKEVSVADRPLPEPVYSDADGDVAEPVDGPVDRDEGFVDRHARKDTKEMSLMERRIERSRHSREKGEELFAGNTVTRGNFELLRWSTNSGRYFLVGTGAGLVMTVDPWSELLDFLVIDFIKVGYQAGRHSFTVGGSYRSFEEIIYDDIVDWRRDVIKKDLYYGAVTYGFEMFHLFNNIVTVTPGVTGGYFYYKKFKQRQEDTPPGSGQWLESTPNELEKIGFLGPQVKIDAGKRYWDWMGVYFYVQPTMYYISDFVLFTSIGLQFVF